MIELIPIHRLRVLSADKCHVEKMAQLNFIFEI